MSDGKRWINTKVVMVWNSEKGKYIEDKSKTEGYFYEGPMALADGDGDGSAGGSGDGASGGSPDLGQIVQGLAALNSSLGQLAESQKGLTERLGALEGKKGKADDGAGDNDDDDDDEPSPGETLDLERLSRKEMFDIMIKTVGKVVDKRIGEVNKKVDSVKTTMTTTEVKKELEGVIKENPEVLYLEDEFKAMVKEFPGATPKKLWRLVKAEYPERIQEIQEKLAEDKKKADEKVDAKKFGGLRPKPTTGKDGTRTAKGEDAAEIAWNETMLDFQEQ